MITAIEILRREPLAAGAAFGAVGAYVKLIGTARGEVDPEHPGNRGIVNLGQAPRNARGRVEYQCDLYILRPTDAAKGNGRILYEVNNRGRKLLFTNLADGPAGSNDPQTSAELGNAFPLRQGYTVVWSGWDPDAPRANAGLGMMAPVATEQGRPISRAIRDEFGFGTRPGGGEVFRLSYAPASLDPGAARLTVRQRHADPRREIPRSSWAFADARTVRLLPEGTKPQPGSIYEFFYTAKEPKVLGLGFAATRDVISRLRHAASDVTGRPISHALAIGFSQGGRFLRDFIGQGFNRDETGNRVFDGMLAHIAGVGRLFLNESFAQPFRTGTQHEDHDFPENEFPFAAATLADPLTGRSSALFRGDGFDPLLIATNTSTEYWQKGASLLHTDPLGSRDVAQPANARVYMIAGTQHGGRAGATSDPGPCANPRNPHNPMPAVRALLVALDAWVVSAREPPASRVPSLADGTLVEAEAIGFPAIPGVAVARQVNAVAPPGDWVNPEPPRRAYRPLVCRVDGDGNEVAGIRLPDIAVPRGTYTGWNLYQASYPEGELADRDGSFIAFAPNAVANDPRRSLRERYPTHDDYVAKVEAVAAALVADRLLLPEDAARYIERAKREGA